MISKPYVALAALASFIITFRILVHGVTGLRHSRIDDKIAENSRTRRIQNYLLQRALNKDGIGDIDITGVEYASESTEPETSPEELPELIVDYANMIRNDVILLDNSVQTRTRKRGNIKFEKYNQAIPDTPCSCEYNRKAVDLGEDFYPRLIENRTCSRKMCPEAYECQEKIYYMAVLRRKAYIDEKSSVTLPYDLNNRWIEVQQPVTIGCLCASDYIKHTH